MTTIKEAHPDIFGPTETETPVDVINSLQEPAKPVHAQPDPTALALRASLDKVTGALTEFDRVSAGLAELQRKYKDVAYPVATKAGMAEAVAARLAIRQPRYGVEKLRKDAKAPVLALGRDIDARAAYISTALLALEEPVQDQIQAQEKREEAERQAKREAEEQRVAAHQSRIDDIRQVAIAAAGDTVERIDSAISTLAAFHIGPICEEFEAATRNAQTETLEKLRSMRAAQAQRDAEAAELARLRAEDEKRRAEEAAALAESRRVEGERLKAEAQALAEARKAQAAELAAQRARQEEIEAAAAAERAKLLREANEAHAAARAMREVEEAQARRAAEERRQREEDESAQRRRAEIDAIAEQQRQDAERLEADARLSGAASVMLAALIAVRAWDIEPNAMPAKLAIQVQDAIERASPADAVLDSLPVGKPAAKRPAAASKPQLKRVKPAPDPDWERER